jgi:hypothetical protein
VSHPNSILSGLSLLLAVLMFGCPTSGPTPQVDDDDDDDDAATPGLDDPGCTLIVTNELGTPVVSINSADNIIQFGGVELLDTTLSPGATVDLELEPRGHHLVAQDDEGGWYQLGWVLCVWDEALSMSVLPDDLREPGLKIENGTSEDIVSLLVSPVGSLDWGDNLVAGSPIDQFSNRTFPLEQGRWYAIARNAQGLGYLANFQLLAQPPQIELGISRMLVVPGEPCIWTISNQHDSPLVRITFTEVTTGAFLATAIPDGDSVASGESVEGVLGPGTWDLDVRFMDGLAAFDTSFVCVDGDSYLLEAAP